MCWLPWEVLGKWIDRTEETIRDERERKKKKEELDCELDLFLYHDLVRLARGMETRHPQTPYPPHQLATRNAKSQFLAPPE